MADSKPTEYMQVSLLDLNTGKILGTQRITRLKPNQTRYVTLESKYQVKITWSPEFEQKETN